MVHPIADHFFWKILLLLQLAALSICAPQNVWPSGQVGTRLFGFEGCSNQQFIKDAYDEVVKLAATEGVAQNVKFNSQEAKDFFGEGVRTEYQRTIQRVMSEMSMVRYGDSNLPERYIHVRCDDTPNICANEQTGDEKQAYSDQDDGQGFAVVNFCPLFFQLKTLQQALDDGIGSSDDAIRNDLQQYDNRARCFYHEITHMQKIITAPTQSAITDWELTIKVGGAEETAVAYTAGWAKVLARYHSKSQPSGWYTSTNAENYAFYAVARYVADNGLGKYPAAPYVSAKPIRAPVEPDDGSDILWYTRDAQSQPQINTDHFKDPHTYSVSPGVTQPPAVVIDDLVDDSAFDLQWQVQQRAHLASVWKYGISGKKLRILPLGDSITNGFQSTDGNGYRAQLYSSLSGNTIEMVGSVRAGSMADNRNEGHNGFEITQISDVVTDVLKTRPNVILLHAGTNDLNKNDDVNNAPTRLASLIDKLISACPDATIFVAWLIPSGNGATNARINAFNGELPQIVADRVSKGSKVFLVDQNRISRAAGDYADDLHPNDQGYKKMGLIWRDAIAFASGSLDWITDPVTGTTAPGLVPCDKNPIWIPNQQIANGAGLGNAMFPDVVCSQSSEVNVCNCGSKPTDPSGIALVEYTTPLVGDNCDSMGYTNIRAVMFADLNGDGRAEYLRIGSKGEVHAFYNQGPATGQNSQTGAQVGWWDAGQIASGIGARPEEIRFADLNGDGRAEYIWVHPNGSASVWFNQGQNGATPANVGWFAQGLVAGGTGLPGSHVHFADLNGDGRAEYIALNADGGAVVYLNLGPRQGTDPRGAQVGWLPQKQTATGVGGNADMTVFADINGDGRADYLYMPYAPQGNGEVRMWLNGGAPDDGPHAGERVWISRDKIADGDGTPAKQIMFADLNGDGRAEYLEVDPATGAVNAYLNGCAR